MAADRDVKKVHTTDREEDENLIETIIALIVLGTVGYYSYYAGKQVGSRKGFGAGRYGRK